MSYYKLSALLLLSSVLIGCDNKPDSITPFELAKTDFEQAHYAESLLHVKRAIQLNPDDTQARTLLAKILIKVGDPLEAQRHLEKVIELGVSKKEVVLLLGTALIKQKKYDKVLEDITLDADMMSFSAEDQAEIYALRGQAQLGKNLTQQSLSSFRRALSLSEDCARAYIGLSSLSFHEKDFEKAEYYLQRAFELDETNPDAWALKGDFARIQGDIKQAEMAYTHVIEESHPTSVEAQQARLYRALVRAHDSDAEEAWRDIRKVKVISGENVYVNYVAGVVAFQAKEYDKAQAALEKVLSVNPEHIYAHFLLGSVHYLKNQPRQARENLAYFVNEAPENELAQKMLAMVEFNLGETTQAVSRLNDILVENPTDIQALNILGQHYLSAGDAKKGLSLLKRSLDRNPKSQGAQLRYGLGNLDLGEFEMADKAFQNALKLDKHNKPAQYYQLLSYLKNGQPEKTLAQADKLLAEEPDNILALNFKGITYIALKDLKNAKAQFKAVLEKQPGDPTAHFNLANLALQDNDVKTAKNHLDKVVKHNPKMIRGYLKQTHLAIQENDLASAEQWLRQAKQVAPQDIQTNLALAKLLSAQNRTVDALTVLTELNEKAKQNHQVLLALAEVYTKTSQYALAQQTLNQLESRYPAITNAQGYMALRALLYTKENQLEKAANMYQELQKKYPFQRWVVALAAIEWDSNKQKAAIQTLVEWLKDNPDDSIAQVTLANYYMLLDKRDKALEAFYKAEDLMPDHPFVLNNIAWLLKDKDLDKAYEYAQRAIKLSSDENILHTHEVITEKRNAVN